MSSSTGICRRGVNMSNIFEWLVWLPRMAAMTSARRSGRSRNCELEFVLACPTSIPLASSAPSKPSNQEDFCDWVKSSSANRSLMRPRGVLHSPGRLRAGTS